jgi:hypothetical protein
MAYEPNIDSVTPRPIEICISFPWTKRSRSTVPLRQDRRWAFLREVVNKVIAERETRSRVSPGEHELDIRLYRLRGRQGMHLLSTLRDRIERHDALVMGPRRTQSQRAPGSRNGCCDEERGVRRSNHPEAKARSFAQQSSGARLLQLR